MAIHIWPGWPSNYSSTIACGCEQAWVALRPVDLGHYLAAGPRWRFPSAGRVEEVTTGVPIAFRQKITIDLIASGVVHSRGPHGSGQFCVMTLVWSMSRRVHPCFMRGHIHYRRCHWPLLPIYKICQCQLFLLWTSFIDTCYSSAPRHYCTLRASARKLLTLALWLQN